MLDDPLRGLGQPAVDDLIRFIENDRVRLMQLQFFLFNQFDETSRRPDDQMRFFPPMNEAMRTSPFSVKRWATF